MYTNHLSMLKNENVHIAILHSMDRLQSLTVNVIKAAKRYLFREWYSTTTEVVTVVPVDENQASEC